MAYMRGVSAVWAVVGYTIAELLMFVYAAPRLRELTELHQDLTIPDFFESHLKDSTHILRNLSVIIILIFMVSYISAQFVGGGKAFSTSFQISPLAGIVLTATVVLLYTLLGGFLAVSLTDVVQAIFMIVALLVLPIIAIADFGGVESMLKAIANQNRALIDPFSLGTGAFIGFLGIGLGSPGNPHILVRYMSIENPGQLKSSALIGTFWNVVMGWSAIFIGLIGRAYFPTIDQLPRGDAENLFPYLAQLHLHPVIFGIIIAAILAAIMSTADSMLLVCASAIIRDIYQKTIKNNQKIPERSQVFYSRIIIVVLVSIAFFFGIYKQEWVFWLGLFAWGGLGASFGPPLLLSLFWKRTSKIGVVAGFVSGTLTIIIWNQIPYLKSVMYELVPAFIFSTGFTILISRLKPEPN